MKKLLLIVCAFCFSSLAFAQFHLIPNENDRLDQWFEVSYGRSVNKGIERNQSFFSAAWNLDYNPFNLLLGFQYTDEVTDLVIDGDWWLAQFDGHYGRMRLGFELGYHAQWYNNISCEHDINLVPAQLHYRTWRGFWVGLRTGVFRKMSNVYLLQKMINNWNTLLILSLGKKFDFGLEISLDLGTHSRYRYPVFGTAIFTPGIAWYFPSGFRLGAEAEITMKDWIAATYYMESVVVRFTGRILF